MTRGSSGIVRVIANLCIALVGSALDGVPGLGAVICVFMVRPAAQVFLPVSSWICKFFLKRFGGGVSSPER